MFEITMLLWVSTSIARGQSWAPAAGSGVVVAAAAPALVVGPLAGVFVDRWNRRRTMMAADAFRVILIASLLGAPAVGQAAGRAAELACAYAVVALESAAAQFFNPSRLAMLGKIVTSDDQRAKASGLLQAASGISSIVGPAAGAALFASGVGWSVLIDSASFAVSFLAIRGICPSLFESEESNAPAPHFWRELAEGGRFFASNRALMALCGGVVVATMGTGALNALEVFFVTDNLHVAGSWLGLIAAATGVGAIAGALAGGWIASRIDARRLFSGGLVCGGIFLVAFSRTDDLIAAACVAAITGIAFGVLNVSVPVLLLGGVPQNMIGRVMAIFGPAQQVSAIISTAVVGFLASSVLRSLNVRFAGIRFGPIDTIFGVSALLIVLAGCLAPILMRDTKDHSNAPG